MLTEGGKEKHPMQRPPIFQDIKKASKNELQLMGGKASTLAVLLQNNFPVPEGSVLFEEPQKSEDLQELFTWWEQNGCFPVAVRSSASGEDSGDFSYAGQFLTLLHITTETDLRNAIDKCFAAVHQKSSKAYASHFDQPNIPMHVLIQRMIDSKFSGVYFSLDPRKENSSWLIEVVEGQGEQLVSGQVTPFRFSADEKTTPPEEWQPEYLETVAHWGQKVREYFGYEVDMEWAIDQQGRFWILQSRPITAHTASADKKMAIKQELQRILEESSPESSWDGHTFAEWTGIPSELTFDLWSQAFQPGQAFDLSLRSIGYEGLHFENPKKSLLERLFGKAYLNLKLLEPVYFGDSPYDLNPYPRPHLEFNWQKLNLTTLLRAPAGLSRMAQVAWNIQTRRHELTQNALAFVSDEAVTKTSTWELREQCQKLSFTEQKSRLKELRQDFTKKYLQGTFLITLLIESTTQGLLALIEKDLGKEKANDSLVFLTGYGTETVATQMQRELSESKNSPDRWASFLKKFGHRGMGELDLSHPRWIESENLKYKNTTKIKTNTTENSNKAVDDLILSLSALHQPVFKQEWAELQRLLKVREEIKMELMKPYAQIRWLCLEIGKKTKLESNIFWLQLEEILSLEENTAISPELNNIIQVRKNKAVHLRSVDLPMIFTLAELKEVLSEDQAQSSNSTTQGVPLSSGLASGVVHIVNDPEIEDLELWPDNYVLVTEATDPGWTPLFEKAKAIIVSRGGVLSHCAIVAREMGLPAVGEIRGATHLFKEGEHVWVDGTHGTIRRKH